MKTAVCPLCHRRDVPIVEGTVVVGLVMERHTIPTTAAISPYDEATSLLRADCPLSEAVLKP